MTTLLLAPISVSISARTAEAETGCTSTQGTKLDGYQANGSYNGNTYRGIVGNITTRLGYSCDGDPNPMTNNTSAWFAVGGPFGGCVDPNGHFLFTRGYSQAGYWRGTGTDVYAFAETNADGCGPLRRNLWTSVALDSQHRYAETWFPWAGVMASQLDGQIGTSDQAMLYSDFDPVVKWGQYYNTYGDGWALLASGETKYLESDMPGHFGSSALFSAMGSEPDNIGWIGAVGFNQSFNDDQPYQNRWALGGLNAYDPNVYGLNFEIYTY